MSDDDLPPAEDTEAVFENRSIVVFGMGNAGMKTNCNRNAIDSFLWIFH